MTTTYKYKFGDFFGLTISGKYAYTIPLPEGGFTFDMYDTKQHPEPLHEDALYAIGYDLGGGQKRQKPIDVTDAEVAEGRLKYLSYYNKFLIVQGAIRQLRS